MTARITDPVHSLHLATPQEYLAEMLRLRSGFPRADDAAKEARRWVLAARVVSEQPMDETIGRNLRRLTEGLPLHWRIGLMRTETGWRLVMLGPDSPEPLSFLDGPDLESVFADEPVLRGQLAATNGQRTESGHSTWCVKCGLDRVNVTVQAACQCAEPEWSRVPKNARVNLHATVKPTALMRHLIRLVTPAGGTVLDCFLGSGSTALAANAEGFRAVGIEQSAEYLDIAMARLLHHEIGLGLEVAAPTRKGGGKQHGRPPLESDRQPDLIWRSYQPEGEVPA